MRRKLCMIICFLCFLGIASMVRIPIRNTVSAMYGEFSHFIKEKRDISIYEKGIQQIASESVPALGTNLDTLNREEETKRKEERVSRYIDTCISNMSLEEKLAQMMILTNEADITRDHLETYQPGGVLLFSTDFEGKTKKKVRKRIKKLQSYVEIPLFVGVDEEGGGVSRIAGLKSDDIPIYLSARELYKEENTALVREESLSKTNLLKSMGINLNFNPVADVVNDQDAYMYERSAGGNAQKVSGYVETVVSVMRENNMGSCLKHFPGYGNNENTHLTYAEDKRSLSVYQTNDFLPFEAGIKQGADMVMVSHIVMKKADKKNPASLSPKVHSILRGELGFEGVVIADDLKMKAILDQMTIEEATGKAFVAGNDMIFSADFDASMKGAKTVVEKEELSERQINESVARILRMKINRELIIIE